MNSSDSDLHSLAGPYALDALTEPERAHFESHLSMCSACRAEVAEFQATAARMGAAVAQPPPPALKSRVLAEIAQTRQLPPPVVQSRVSPPVAPGPSRPRRRQFLLAAAAAGILGAGGIAAYAISRTSRSNDELIAILAEPDSVTRKAKVAGGGQVTVVASQTRDAAVVILEGVPEAPDGRTHQLWMIGDRAESAGTVDVSSSTPKDVVIRGGVSSAAAFGMTIEPAGGSPQPSTEPIATVELR